jgi:hypothetical protein
MTKSRKPSSQPKKAKTRKPSNQPKKANGLPQALQAIPWLANLIPGVTCFVDLAPPYFPPIGIFLSVFGVAYLLLGYHQGKPVKSLMRRSIVCLSVSVFFLVCYSIALHYCTAVAPADRHSARRQIAFYMWPLTEKACTKIEDLASDDPPIEVNTPDDLMNVFGVWGGKGREDEIWYPSSIIAAGLLLVFLYLVAFALWTYCMGLLSRAIRKQKLAVS